ncbi:MAG TPA: DUF4932 domain-containing protein [Bacteroidota bacterium]|nr:DUF4932 domain-containing protein [Bacteroidota bacterium]
MLALQSTERRIPVSTDPRIELMGVIQVLADYFVVTPYNSRYKQDVIDYFAPFKNHPAIQGFHHLSERGFGFDAVPAVMLCLSDPPELVQRIPFPKSAIERAGDRQAIDDWLQDVRDFAQSSQFMRFYNNRRPTYDAIVRSTEPQAEKALLALQNYSGMALSRCSLLLGLLLHDGGFATTLEDSEGVQNIAIIGPTKPVEDTPVFGPSSRIAGLTWHEFSHTFVNALTEAHWDSLRQYESLYTPIAKQLTEQAYPDWQTAVNEHIIVAITVRLKAIHQEQEAAEHELKTQKEKGFIYAEDLANRLVEFENSRERYPMLAQFFPKLVAVFRDLAHNGQGFGR